jgi:dihydroorotase
LAGNQVEQSVGELRMQLEHAEEKRELEELNRRKEELEARITARTASLKSAERVPAVITQPLHNTLPDASVELHRENVNAWVQYCMESSRLPPAAD